MADAKGNWGEASGDGRPVEAGAALPPHYGEDRLGCLVSDPRLIHCYWELEGGARRRITDGRGSGFLEACRWVIRVCPQGAPLFDVEVDPGARDIRVEVEPRRRYRTELGLVAPDGEYVMLAAGNEVETPAEDPCVASGPDWHEIRGEIERLAALKGLGSGGSVSMPVAAAPRESSAGGPDAAPREPDERPAPTATGTPRPGGTGRLVLVLHAHLPYVRHPEHERFLEEDWLFEAIVETYVPLADMLEGLRAEGVRPRAGVVLSPTLCEMLSDPVLQGRCAEHIERLIRCADAERERLHRAEGGSPFLEAAEMYCGRLRRVRDLYRDRERNPLNAFRALAGNGVVEIIACAATHGLLPLMKREESVRAQIEIGCRNHEKHFGSRPRGMWLPECAYRPGLDRLLAESGLEYFFLDSHGVLFGSPSPKYLTMRPVRTPAGLVAFGRDGETGVQVWSAEQGYPGDPAYREFYRDLGFDGEIEIVKECLHPDGERRGIGLRYHRVTGKVPLDRKEPYVPSLASARAREHAEHFVATCVSRVLRETDRASARFGTNPACGAEAPAARRRPVICAMYDAELFGHWWYEGVEFLREVFRATVRAGRALESATPSEITGARDRPKEEFQAVGPSASSWGNRGYYEHWVNWSNSWIYPHLHKAEDRMVDLARRFPEREGTDKLTRRALDQAARELLLAQASDWAFLMATGTAPDYSTRRTRDHVAQFTRLHDMILAGRIDEADLAQIERRDAIFAEIDYRVYARAGRRE